MSQSQIDTRRIESIHMTLPHNMARTPAEATAFIEAFDESKPCEPFTRYEVGVRYNNGDEIRGQFNDKATAVAFLRGIR